MKKDIEWAKKKIKEIHTLIFDSYEAAVIANNKHFQTKNSEQLALINKIMEMLDQLDEPEVLSQEWIERKYFNVDNLLDEYENDGDKSPDHTPQIKVIALQDLQNVIMPKQELPVIPKFVAEHIENRRGESLAQAYNVSTLTKVGKWLLDEKNCETFARAWLDGYEVEEEEPLYRARLKVITEEFIASYLRTQSSDAENRLKALEIGSKYTHEDYRHLSEFTEDELKRLDIWDSEQWEVEELEE